MLKRECFSKSSIGRKIRRSFRSSDEALRASVSTATAFFLASGRSEVSGPRLRQLAGRYPMAVAGLARDPGRGGGPGASGFAPIVSPSVAATQSRDEARPLGVHVDPLGEAFRPIREMKLSYRQILVTAWPVRRR